MLLSIIIPAYNAERYLEKCISGLIHTTPFTYEVIIINDGSTDNTSKIASSYASQYSYIKYIEQENSGVSSARNTGLKVAAGKYITFVDADDELLELPAILEMLADSNYDLVIGDFHEINPDGKIVRSRQLSKSISDNRELLDQELLGNYLLNTCWGKFYLNHIIKEHQITFPPQVKMGEDLIFVLHYMQYVNHFHCLPVYIYNYLQLDSGAVRRLRNQITPELISNKVSCIIAKQEYMKCFSLSPNVINSYYEYQLADIVSTINMMLKSESSISTAYRSLRSLVTAPALQEILITSGQNSSISSKRRLITKIYLSPFLSILYVICKMIKKRKDA
ncbi:MAG: glycosyltransferase [Lachnospiraceae bacterium]|nr:glycosyltransferase [Lachnospiraceae bacterium]